MNVFQISLSAFVGPNLVYYTLVYWVYPMKDYIGEAGCHMINSCRLAGAFGAQLQSFFVAIFRYICLFHGSSMRRVNLSPHVSCAASFWIISLPKNYPKTRHHLCMFLKLNIFFSGSGKVDLSDQLFSSFAILFCLSNWAYSRVGCMSWKRILLFFLNSIWSLLLWQ